MSILNVNKINPVGGGSTVTIAGIASVTNAVSVGNSVTAGSFVGPIEGNVTGNVTGNADTASGLSGNPSINTTGIVTATSFVPTVGQLSHRNIIVNGAMLISQRGTAASTTNGYGSVDRVRLSYNSSGLDEVPSQIQSNVSPPSSPYHLPTSGDHPYKEGFRKCFNITNGNQTSGAGAGDFIKFQYRIEAQDIANSGWNYTDPNSFITLSFWIKSSVAQNFYGYLETFDTSGYLYPFETGSLSAFTWKKVTKKIPGNSNLTVNNDNGSGLQIEIQAFMGTNSTDSGVALNTWAAYAPGTRTPDQTSTWFTTNDASLEITGLQLEVGSVATPFEHRSFGDELNRCQRYYQQFIGMSDQAALGFGRSNGTTVAECNVPLSVPLRASPSLNSCNWAVFTATNQSNVSNTTPSVRKWDAHSNMLAIGIAGLSGMTNARTLTVFLNSSHTFSMDAEL